MSKIATVKPHRVGREKERERERDHEVESNQKKRERTFYKNVEFRNLSLLLLSMLSSAVPHICTW
jgi:hypothetical protein